MIETRGFNGKLNLDDNDYRVAPGEYLDALNITRDAQGHGQDESVSNVVGNVGIENTGTDLEYSNTSTIYGHTCTNDIVFSGNDIVGAPISIELKENSTGNWIGFTSYTVGFGDTLDDVVTNLVNNQVLLTYANAYAPGAAATLEVTYDIDPIVGYSDIRISIGGYHFAGINKTIGNYADKVRNRHYFFNWNSNGYNRISYYDATYNVSVVVMEDLTNTGNISVLNFDPSYRINHIDIIYRDEEGDLLFWTDGLNPPSKINVKTATTGGYGLTIERSYIDVAKEPPSTPPYCAYGDDGYVSINNLNNKLFKFKYRFVYDDLEKSVTSAQSELAIPYEYSKWAISGSNTKNNYLNISVETGALNVTKIEILAAENLGTTFSDFFLIKVLDKQSLSIDNNTIYNYKFLNDQAYSAISLTESIQPFDNVPQIAYTQSLPNGNVLDYGAITEGYDNTDLDAETSVLESSITHTVNASNRRTDFVIVGYETTEPNGDISVRIFMEGVGVAGDIAYIDVLEDGVTTTQITGSGGAYPSSYLSNIISNAISAGFDAGYQYGVSDTIYIKKADHDITLNRSPYVVVLPNYTPNSDSSLAYDWNSRYSYGVVYFDEKGRTNGVVSTPESAFQTQQYQEAPLTNFPPYLPTQEFAINSRPPLWASYYHIVRTKNLSKSNFLYWVSETTYKDTFANQAGYKYAYISINTLTQYIIDNPEYKTLGYEFTQGDRIRFIKLYSSTGTTSQIYSDKDYQILESLTNPTINGKVINGQVIKIVLPTTSGTFDFGTTAFNNYLIELYTPALNYSNELNLYYEFGERYGIGNAGEANAYHLGMTQNQTDDLSQPALFKFYKGDYYYRNRLYPTGGEVIWDHNPKNGIVSQYYYMLATVTTNTVNDTSYTGQNVTTQSIGSLSSYPIIVNTPSTPPSLNLKGRLRFKPSVNGQNGTLYTVEVDSSNNVYLSPTILAVINPTQAGIEQIINININYTPPVGYNKIGWALSGVDGDLLELTITATNARTIYQGIIDPNFSDTYSSSASVNGRAWKYDPNAEQSFNPTLIRFGGEYQAGTTVNNINRFYEENYDVYDRSRGSIKKMFIEGRNQYIFQEFDVGVVTVLTQIVRDTAGNPLSAQSDNLLNKIVYPYIGGYGIGNVPESFAYGKHAKFFVDNNKGVVCRLSNDGITPISIVYKMNNYFVNKLAGFKENLNITIPETGTPTVYGAYDAYTNKYIIALSAIDRIELHQDAYTISFLDSRDNKQGFESFLSFNPENMGALNNLFISFYNGKAWTHNNSVYCNFYDTQYDCYIEVVFNDQPLDKKTFLSVMETSNAIWDCPSITSQLNSYGSTPQFTYIVYARFSLLEGQYYAAILRDANSSGGIINGSTMHGNYLIVRFQRPTASDYYYLNTVSLKYITSPLNVR